MVAALAAIVLRARVHGRPRRLDGIGLDPGVYLLTSAACPDCASVRRTLTDELGQRGYTEVRWEEEPGVFHRLAIDAVPATLIVDEDGSGTLWPGRAKEALASLGP